MNWVCPLALFDSRSTPRIMSQNLDIIIVGAGLSGLLTAWRCLDVNPNLRIQIIEASDKIAGDHTWYITYCTGNSDTLRACVQPHIESGRLNVHLNTEVEEVEPDHVILKNGEKKKGILCFGCARVRAE